MAGHATFLPHTTIGRHRLSGASALLVRREGALARFGGGWCGCSGRARVRNTHNCYGRSARLESSYWVTALYFSRDSDSAAAL